ncbi:hypothetical protein BBP40_001543 [Aspergillus hancockii]|nr:hypothetical protein BBP40_001543 [Aspergillus hancockii]
MGFRRRKQIHQIQPYPEEAPATYKSSDSLYTIPTAASTVCSLSTASTLYSYDSTTTTTLSLSGTTLASENLSTETLSHESQASAARRHKARRSLAKYQSYADLSGVIAQSVVKANATKLKARDSVLDLEQQMRDYVTHTGMDIYGATLKKLDDMITSMDERLFRDKEDMVTAYGDDKIIYTKTGTEKEVKQTSACLSFFAKAYLYLNSRLPAHLPLLQIPPQTYALIHLAAQYSHSAYRRPAEPTTITTRNRYVSPNILRGTKAMVIKSLASEDLQSIVLAIRGTQSFRDWAVNMKTLPTSPRDFLDDPYNLCHAGFLAVAQKMAPSVAAYLRDLLAENPNRASYSLIITGHSAGGAVASLLYCHLLSTKVSSELRHLASFFKSIHCVTFGAPPVSVRPLFPRKSAVTFDSMFYAFVNEGDPVPRAEKPYVTSLLNLYVQPAPFSLGTSRTYPFVSRKTKPAVWRVPPPTLSLAGNVVLLRKQCRDPLSMHSNLPSAGQDPTNGKEEIEACQVPHEILKEVIFGDPIKHMMGLYAERIGLLAHRAQHQQQP